MMLNGSGEKRTSKNLLPTVFPFSYDQIAEFYDEDMGRNNPGLDISFYAEVCRGTPGPILELGCGTGRITLALVKSGHQVMGIDRSLPMLKVLSRKAAVSLSVKERQRLSFIQADMRAYPFQTRFAFILCPFSGFTYLTKAADRELCFKQIRACLAPEGEFIFDLFVPDEKVDALPDSHLFHDYSRTLPDGTILTRTRTIRKNVQPQINIIERHYDFLDPLQGTVKKRVSTMDVIRCSCPDEVADLLEKNGFKVSAMLGDFREGPFQKEARTVCFRCQLDQR